MKLEINKRYMLRNGAITEPLEHSTGLYPFIADVGTGRGSWTSYGVYDITDDESPYDIIAVFDEAAPEPVHVNEALILHVMEVAHITLRLPRVAVKIADELDLSDESMHEIISFLEFKLK